MRASERTGASVRTSSRAASSRGSRPIAARRDRRTPARPTAGGDRRGGREQRAVLREQRDDLRDRRLRREVRGVPGVHAAEQGLGQPVDDLRAEPRAEQLRDRDVVRAERVRRSRGSLGRDPSSESTPEAASARGRAGRRAGSGAAGRSAPRVHSWDESAAGWATSRPELGCEPDALGTPGEHRLGADVDLDPADALQPELAADVRRTLEHEHGQPGRRQVAGRGEPADAGADHHHVGSRLGHGIHSRTPGGSDAEPVPFLVPPLLLVAVLTVSPPTSAQ